MSQIPITSLFGIVLSVFGLALLFLSASALGNARISARQGREIDATAAIVAKTIGNNAINFISKLLSIPSKAMSGLTSVIVATLLYPFQLIGRAAGAIGDAGNAAVNSIVDLFTKASSFPSFVQDLVALSLKSIMGWLSNSYDKSCIWITSLPRLLLSHSKVWLAALGGSIKNRSKSLGNTIVSNLAWLLSTTGTIISNRLGSFLYISRCNIDKVGTEIIVAWSSLVSYVLAFFKGGTNGSTT